MSEVYQVSIEKLVGSLTDEQAFFLFAELGEDINTGHYESTQKMFSLLRERFSDCSQDQKITIAESAKKRFGNRVR